MFSRKGSSDDRMFSWKDSRDGRMFSWKDRSGDRVLSSVERTVQIAYLHMFSQKDGTDGCMFSRKDTTDDRTLSISYVSEILFYIYPKMVVCFAALTSLSCDGYLLKTVSMTMYCQLKSFLFVCIFSQTGNARIPVLTKRQKWYG